ncbi:cyclin dependent kinase inhibitor family protein [Striga asiatica]|uniref:Cyclin dependent kinase inhibitor family protein n=1 Tax=Striga asiatica TaxID=4170 RepID=A0A5A7RHK4_STRAF|nr:cyclin dependent kinase inhibitor family protein [Striga asiatica]
MISRGAPPRVPPSLAARYPPNGIAMCLSPLKGSGPHVTEREMSVTAKAWRTTAADMELISSKKRKFCSEIENEGYGGGEVEPSPENSASTAASTTCGGFYEHEECSSGVVKKRSSDLEIVDLQSECFRTESSTSIARVFREATPTSDFYGDSDQVSLHPIFTVEGKKSTPPVNSRRKIVKLSPSPSDLEEFFAAAEKYDQKRFVEKYNYDIIRDVPLEGKYQWVRLHP